MLPKTVTESILICISRVGVISKGTSVFRGVSMKFSICFGKWYWIKNSVNSMIMLSYFWGEFGGLYGPVFYLTMLLVFNIFLNLPGLGTDRKNE